MTYDYSPRKTFITGVLVWLTAMAGLIIGIMFGFASKAQAASYSIFTTSYNPAVAQTDDTPCTGASGRDLCTAAKEGDHVIALSRDLLWFRGGPFRWHDKVKLASDIPQCNGVFSVEDTMSEYRRIGGKRVKRTLMGDLFFLDRRDNTSCTATIEKAE